MFELHMKMNTFPTEINPHLDRFQCTLVPGDRQLSSPQPTTPFVHRVITVNNVAHTSGHVCAQSG